MKSYLFDVKLFAALRITAENEEEARKKLHEILDCATVQIENNGQIITGEASIDGDADCNEIEENDDCSP